MSLTIVQHKSGSTDTTDVPATLDDPTTAGNTLLIFTYSYGTQMNIPPGFAEDLRAGTAGHTGVYRETDTPGGETSWALSQSTAVSGYAWAAAEMQDIDIAVLADASTSGLTNTATVSTGTTGAVTAPTGIAFAVHGGAAGNAGGVPTWSGQTNGYTELEDAGRLFGSAPQDGLALAVSYLLNPSGTQECTATRTNTGGSGNYAGLMVVYAEVGFVEVPAGIFVAPVVGS